MQHGRPGKYAVAMRDRCAMFGDAPGHASARAFFMRAIRHHAALKRFPAGDETCVQQLLLVASAPIRRDRLYRR